MTQQEETPRGEEPDLDAPGDGSESDAPEPGTEPDIPGRETSDPDDDKDASSGLPIGAEFRSPR